MKYLSIMTMAKCNLNCPSCSVVDFRNKHSDYELSKVDLDRFIYCTQKSNYCFDKIVLTGGEPLIWKHLLRGVRKIKESRICTQLAIQTNGIAINEDTFNSYDNIFNYVDIVRFSMYSTNTKTIEFLKNKRGNKEGLNTHKYHFADRTNHWELPRKKYDNVLPANCICGTTMLKGNKIYICGSLVTLIDQFGWDEAKYDKFIVGLTINYLNAFNGITKFAQDHCQYCSINKNIIDQLKKIKA
jgi:organic radical activating enzyme